jgi:hypothetical protein
MVLCFGLSFVEYVNLRSVDFDELRFTELRRRRDANSQAHRRDKCTVRGCPWVHFCRLIDCTSDSLLHVGRRIDV